MRVHGIPQTKAALAKIRVQVEAASPTAVRAGGEVVQRAMVARAPRDTGALAIGISVDVVSLGEGATAHVGSSASYDRYVQRGTRHMSAQPYGQDAADASHGGVATAMASVYKAAVD